MEIMKVDRTAPEVLTPPGTATPALIQQQSTEGGGLDSKRIFLKEHKQQKNTTNKPQTNPSSNHRNPSNSPQVGHQK